MNNTLYLWVCILVVAIITFLERGLPFVLFARGDQNLPGWVTYLGKVLPCTIMAVLVVYCLKGGQGIHGLLQLICVGLTAALQWWRGNTALSIGVGTLAYMILIRIF